MSLTVVKIGGNVIDNPDVLDHFVSDFAQLPTPKILVHGGGKLATRLSSRLGIETTMIEGRRVTDKETLEIVTMVYAGFVNKSIVAKLQSVKCNAIGLSGSDANTIPATRRPSKPIDYGFVGDINPFKINVRVIKMFLDANIIPVFCALTHDEKGSMLNSNADSVASSLAVAMAKITEVNLVFCFEKLGVLKNIENPDSLISEITPEKYSLLKKKGVINSGMIPKIDNAFSAIQKGVKSVTIKYSGNINQDIGTIIKG